MEIKMTNQFNPDFYAPPGWTLLEEIERRGMPQTALAKALEVSPKFVNELIKGKAALSTDTAIGLEKVLHIPARLWMSMENQYQLKEAEKRERETLKGKVDILKQYPIRQMQKNGWLNVHEDKVDQLYELMQFFSINNPEKLTLSSAQDALFRRTGKHAINPHAVNAWLQKGLVDGIAVECDSYDVESFKSALREIRSLTQKAPDQFEAKLKSLCADSGVAVVLTKELPNTGLCGCARWISSKKALIQLSLRYKSNDHFWFAFFHEAGHILKHNKTEKFIEYDKKNAITDDESLCIIETEADKFAGDMLIPKLDYSRFIEICDFSEKSIKIFALDTAVHPGIVVGRLQHDGFVAFNSSLNKLKMRLCWIE